MLNIFKTTRSMNPKSLIILCLFITSLSTAQEAGKIITSHEADQKFGSVGHYVSVPISLLEEILINNDNVLMLKISDDGLVILDSKRNVLFPKGAVVSEQEVFTVYSTSILSELLTRGSGSDLHIEQRAEVLSITFGLFTLEYGWPCPPVCNN